MPVFKCLTHTILSSKNNILLHDCCLRYLFTRKQVLKITCLVCWCYALQLMACFFFTSFSEFEITFCNLNDQMPIHCCTATPFIHVTTQSEMLYNLFSYSMFRIQIRQRIVSGWSLCIRGEGKKACCKWK